MTILRAAWLILFGLIALLAWDGYRLHRATDLNAVLERGDVAALAARAEPEAKLAHGLALAREGDLSTALVILKAVERTGAPALRDAARYTSGNAKLRAGLLMAERKDEPAARTLYELAKESYRATLADNPQHWNARYNLERALVLAPELDAEDEEAGPDPLDAERAATTMRATTLGLP